MSKTFLYVIAVIVIYLVVVVPNITTINSIDDIEEKEENKADTKSGTGLNENADKNGVSKGAAGQQKYRFGYTS